MSDKLERVPEDLPLALKDIIQGLPAKSVAVVRGNSTNIRSSDIYSILCTLNLFNIQTVNLNLRSVESKEMYYKYLKEALDISEERNSFILCEPDECESILKELTESNLIHRTILYIFFWPYGIISHAFKNTIKEAMRVAVIIQPRENVFRVYYSQANPNRLNHFTMVNWWSGSLYKSPVLPPPSKVYRDFKRRLFQVPVLHAPPWHFVQYNNSTVNVTGGRDDKLLAVLANKLNFRYSYYDPPDRSQGSSISGNGTFRGTLGLLWKREADFFLGDVTITWERMQAVEFTFLTLADSGAFLTHAPAKLSETLAIIRPFQWQVWPLVCITLLASGPALWFVTAAPSLWLRKKKQNQLSLFNNCCWFTTTLFLRQSSNREPSKTLKARLVAVLISLGATYVIGDMYSANLTSLLAKPAREQPIGTLPALEEAMRDRGYELVVERHSSSLTILENGTGVYGRLAKLMRRQRVQRVGSVEVGVRMVLSKRHIAVLGGRETLYYDTERFGSHNFHLSEKLYTRYSAIALQFGCPYIDIFNSVLMTLFEAGILGKMTTDEYKNLPEHSRRSEPVTETDGVTDVTGEVTPTSQAQGESTKGLQPLTLRMLRGAFLLLGLGQLLAIISFSIEIQIHRRNRLKAQRKSLERHTKEMGQFAILLQQTNRVITRVTRRVTETIIRNIDNALGPALH